MYKLVDSYQDILRDKVAENLYIELNNYIRCTYETCTPKEIARNKAHEIVYKSIIAEVFSRSNINYKALLKFKDEDDLLDKIYGTWLGVDLDTEAIDRSILQAIDEVYEEIKK